MQILPVCKGQHDEEDSDDLIQVDSESNKPVQTVTSSKSRTSKSKPKVTLITSHDGTEGYLASRSYKLTRESHYRMETDFLDEMVKMQKEAMQVIATPQVVD